MGPGDTGPLGLLVVVIALKHPCTHVRVRAHTHTHTHTHTHSNIFLKYSIKREKCTVIKFNELS